jgi:Rrf2 family nitric oxide-sensitive transcriptional repressor
VLKEALGAFLATLDRYTLADLMLRPKDFGLPPAA